MLYELPSVQDSRGELTFAQVGAQLPFVVQRYFTISRMPEGAVRGRHAHRELHEFVVCLQGACTFAVDDGKTRQEVRLERHTVGLHLPPHVWREYFDFTPDALVLVLASDIYRESDYVHDLRELPQERAADE